MSWHLSEWVQVCMRVCLECVCECECVWVNISCELLHMLMFWLAIFHFQLDFNFLCFCPSPARRSTRHRRLCLGCVPERDSIRRRKLQTTRPPYDDGHDGVAVSVAAAILLHISFLNNLTLWNSLLSLCCLSLPLSLSLLHSRFAAFIIITAINHKNCTFHSSRALAFSALWFGG